MNRIRAPLLRVVAIYLSGSFVLLQVVSLFRSELGLPSWVFKGTLILLVAGLPIAIITEVVPPSWLTRRRAVIGGGLAVILFALSTGTLIGAGYLTTLKARGQFDPEKEVILSDFDNKTNDPHLAAAITDALRIDLEQSRFITLASRQRIKSALPLMRLADSTRVTRDIARELAIREGLELVIDGAVSSLGNGYDITIEIVSADSGRVLHSDRVVARNADEVIPALDKLSKNLRLRVGESLRYLNKSMALGDVTTSSLDALKMVSEAERLPFVDPRSVTLRKEAIRLDSTFASAYRGLGVVYYWTGEQRLARESLSKGYELSGRSTRRERFNTIGTYHHYATLNYDSAIAAFEQVVRDYPHDFVALEHLALLYSRKKDYPKCVAAARQQTVSTLGSTLSGCLRRMGNMAEAESTLVRSMRDSAHVNQPAWKCEIARIHAWQHVARRREYAKAERTLRQCADSERLSRRANLMFLSRLYLLRGQLQSGMELRRAADVEGAISPEVTLTRRLRRVAMQMELDLLVFNDPAAVNRTLATEVRGIAWDRMKPDQSRPLLRDFAMFASVVGNNIEAKRLLQKYDATIAATSMERQPGAYVADAFIALNEHHTEKAKELLRRASQWDDCFACVHLNRAVLFERLQQPDSAAIEWESFVDTPGSEGAIDEGGTPHGYEWLAEYFDKRGQRQKAAGYYAKLLDLWDSPDPVLQPRWRHARDRLAQITAAAN